MGLLIMAVIAGIFTFLLIFIKHYNVEKIKDNPTSSINTMLKIKPFNSSKIGQLSINELFEKLKEKKNSKVLNLLVHDTEILKAETNYIFLVGYQGAVGYADKSLVFY